MFSKESSVSRFEVDAFGCRIQLESACPDAYELLERYTFPSFPRLVPNGSRPDIRVRADRSSAEYQLFSNDADVASAGQFIDLIPDVVRVVDDAILVHMREMRAVHAGAVLWGERVLLLPGGTHAGKSSLVAELLRRGATYFSDEYALIDHEGLVHPYPRPLLVRNGSHQQVPMLPCEFGASIGRAPAPTGWILSLQYRPENIWSVAPITQGEAALVLLRNTPHILAESPGLEQVFERAVMGAACYAGQRNDSPDAVDQILRIIDQVG